VAVLSRNLSSVARGDLRLRVKTRAPTTYALGSPGKKDEGGVDIVAGQTSTAFIRTKGDEVERTNVEDPAETQRSSPKMIAHAKNL
jgi:hypothetical protein